MAYQDDLSAAAADVSIDFVTLGMFIIGKSNARLIPDMHTQLGYNLRLRSCQSRPLADPPTSCAVMSRIS